MSRLTWRQDSRTVAFEYTQRGHQAIRIIEVDAATGKPRAVIDEEPRTFFNSWRKFSHDVKNAGQEIIWMSERDGWNHLYLYDGAAGRVKNQITKGEWVVRSVVKVDEDKRQIWFSASGMYPGKDPYFYIAFSALPPMPTESKPGSAIRCPTSKRCRPPNRQPMRWG